MSSFILIRPTVWPQYTNVTDRQNRQTDKCIFRQFSELQMLSDLDSDLDLGLGQGHISMHNTYRTTNVGLPHNVSDYSLKQYGNMALLF